MRCCSLLREVDSLGEHRQQNLPCAAQLAEAGEDQPDHFLDPQVGIEAKTDLARKPSFFHAINQGVVPDLRESLHPKDDLRRLNTPARKDTTEDAHRSLHRPLSPSAS